MNVIDVSEFQGSIDWKKVKADEIDGVIIRAGYGKGNVDERFIDNISGALEAGLHVGIYWFSYAYTEEMAKNEATYCCDLISPYRDKIDMPVFFDWEYDSMKYAKKNGVNADMKLITAMTKAFCDEVSHLGYVAGYYLNLDYSKNYYDESQLEGYKRWFARYTKADQTDCYLWQYASDGSVDGIEGNVDMDVLWGEICSFNPKAVDSSAESTEAKNEADSKAEQPYYAVDNVYTIDVQSCLNVRRGPGVNYDRVGLGNLTQDGRNHANEIGALLPGTRVTCLEVETNADTSEIWIRIPSGWICAIASDGSQYVK